MAELAKLTACAEELRPQIAFILGSGLGCIAERIESACRISFLNIPGLTGTSVVGHRGYVTLGRWAGVPVLVFEGRIHAYEGHPWRTVVMPVQLAHSLGARVLVATNAAGGIHEALTPGSLMSISDHIDCTRAHWWREAGPGGLGGSRPTCYSLKLREMIQQSADEQGVEIFSGVYAQLAGPCYETPAEIRAMRSCGADAVGMSTAREVQAGCDLGMQCAGISCITNRAAGLSDGPLNHDEVLTTALQQRDRLAAVLETFVRKFKNQPALIPPERMAIHSNH